MREENVQTTFSRLALALANDYDSIFVIDAENDSYVEYTAEGADKELKENKSGDDFFEDVKKDCMEQVWPEDQSYFLSVFQKENVIKALNNGKSFSLSYRLNISGEPKYYFLKTIRGVDQEIIIGVQNIDEQMRRDMEAAAQSRTYSEIAESLASLFEVIYYVDIETDDFAQYSSSESYARLGLQKGGKHFFDLITQDICKVIHPEDQEMLISELDKDTLLDHLESLGSISLTYRQVLDGKTQYMNLLVFQQLNDEDRIVVGVRNVDAQKRRENVSETYSRIAGALASRYEVIYYIDSDTNEYTQYSSSEEYAKLGTTKQGEDFFKDASDDIKKYIHPEDKEKVLREMNKEHLMKNLSQMGSISLTYRQLLGDRSQYVNMLVVRPKNDEHHIIMGVTNIDAQMRKEQSIAAQSQTFSEIAMALAQRYEVIYHVNILSNQYTEYVSSDKYARLGINTSGNDFFAETQINMKRDIYPEDYPMMAMAMQKDHLLDSLRETGKNFLTYRLMLDGRPQYTTLIAVRPKEDSTHIIVGVANVDSAKRMELDFEEAIGSAMDMANHDIMTGTDNKRSYAQMEMKLDEDIIEKVCPEFAILVCDINGLKEVNDTKGHNAGDEYIKSASKIIKDTFKNSNIYRIGGDEFVVLLRGEDYQNREQLMREFESIQDEQSRNDLVTLAYGISEFDPIYDMRVQDVFERADNSMYENKRLFKQEIKYWDSVIERLNLESQETLKTDAGESAGEKIKKEKTIEINEEPVTNSDKMSGSEIAEGKVSADGREEHTDRGLSNKGTGVASDKNVNNAQKIEDSVKSEEKSEDNSEDKDLKFYKLFEQLVSVMTQVKGRDVQQIESLLIEISNLFRLSKGVTRLYNNARDEQMGIGEMLCCFDKGLDDIPISTIRVVTGIQSIAEMTVYMTPDEKPLNEEEKWKVELVMRTTLSYVSRNRLSTLVEELTYYDDMGYMNLRSYLQYIEKSVRLGDMVGKTALRYNLRHFSLVNQELGRAVGDRVIRNHYEKLREMIGDRGILCRLGGDNFVAICGTEQLGGVLAYLTETPVKYNEKEGKCVNVSTSVGVFRVPRDFVVRNIGDIMEKIIAAYSAAQSGGKEHIVFYDERLIKSKEKSMRVQKLFPEALRNEEFKVFYQPKVNIHTGELVGAEALCRWFHDGEMVSPADFIPMLEETNDICELDFYMLDHVCQDLRRWIDAGRHLVRVSVNLSRKHMMNANILQAILNVVDKHNIPHSCIEIELTETTTDVEFSDLKKLVNGLQKVGIYTSVDDFGVGYSSLNLIRELPWNVIKVDRSFLPVEGKEDVNGGSIMFKYVVAMAKELGLECIVEGVETQAQLEILRENNCDFAQGFYFDRPLPVSEFESRMDQRGYEV